MSTCWLSHNQAEKPIQEGKTRLSLPVLGQGDNWRLACWVLGLSYVHISVHGPKRLPAPACSLVASGRGTLRNGPVVGQTLSP